MVKVWRTRALLIFLQSIVLIVALLARGTDLLEKRTITSNPAAATWSQITNAQLQPGQNQRSQAQGARSPVSPTGAVPNYRPKYEIAWANPTNYGERYTKDINGVPVYNQPIVVFHETVSSAAETIHFFQTPHYDENEQVSYHTLIKLDGTIVYLVPPEKRAFGAGNSVFDGPNGPEAVKTHLQFPRSVNNFAYHSAFETPPDGRNNKQTHSGYTDAQYRSLAWLIAQSSVPDARITTHRSVDRSGKRIDPRSFDFKKFLNLLHSYRRASAGESQIFSATS